MSASNIGADDYRILTYAKLIDPEIWPEGEDPEVNAQTAVRLKRSLEAAYRIASHDQNLVDPTDIVGRLCLELGIDDHPSGLPMLQDINPEEAENLIAILMGNIPPSEKSEADRPHISTSLSEVEEPHEDPNEQDHVPLVEDYSLDPDHDAEEGISHVGDADEGRHHEDE